jgi:gamma-glutamylcyclotransferase (GGCT)/AIG2-like uncharacterized protein YtfP
VTAGPGEALFVYGTLRRGRAPAAVASRLAGRPRRGPARVAGRLLDLGAYPGAVLEAGAGRIEGELVDVEPADWGWLDRYEGHDPGAPEESLFVRVRTEAEWAGRRQACWIYVYNGPAAGRPVIPGGDWLGRGRGMS